MLPAKDVTIFSNAKNTSELVETITVLTDTLFVLVCCLRSMEYLFQSNLI